MGSASQIDLYHNQLESQLKRSLGPSYRHYDVYGLSLGTYVQKILICDYEGPFKRKFKLIRLKAIKMFVKK